MIETREKKSQKKIYKTQKLNLVLLNNPKSGCFSKKFKSSQLLSAQNQESK
jgi:hypothetical protein